METEKEKCAEVSEEVVCNEREEDLPVIVTIHCRDCQKIQVMSSNPSAKCFYHTGKNFFHDYFGNCFCDFG